MAGYQPLQISAYKEGLIQNRELFLLANDAYPTLQNAFVWRERIKRKLGCRLAGRLQRQFANQNAGITSASFNIYTATGITPESTAQLNPGSVEIIVTPSTITGNLVPSAITNPPNMAYTVQANNAEVFTNTLVGLSNGDQVTISGVVFRPQPPGDQTVNGTFGGPGKNAIELIPANTSFKLGVASYGWALWQSGGIWTKVLGNIVLIDQGNGTLATNPPSGATGTINYTNGNVTLSGVTPGLAMEISFGYFPGLPVMGLRLRENQASTFYQTIAFDMKYAYVFNNSAWSEFIPGTTWNANGSSFSGVDFFWTTNYWIGNGNRKIFWATNYSGPKGDPIRYTDGTEWIDFAPIINNANDVLAQCLALLPFRGRLVAFNTWEGPDLANANVFTNRIRWAAIGTPFTTVSTIVSSGVNADAWHDDIRGQGGFLDIPTSEDIVTVGFVRDNLVIYCERSTWQLRYTGRSIAPFQIEKVNSENGAEGTFSQVQFDRSLVGIGDKGILECDSYSSKLIDIKIPDFVFNFSDQNDGASRVHGIRDFIQRLAYWTIPIADQGGGFFPTQRLVYNYENDSWALFNDSLTCLGTLQSSNSPTWLQIDIPWIEYEHNWLYGSETNPNIVGGNQQGYVEFLDQQVTNDVSLFISAISATAQNTVQITSPNHNMSTGFVIGISGIAPGNPPSPYISLNNGVYQIILVDTNNFTINTYNPLTDAFDVPVPFVSGTYFGGGQINIRENFTITSKKFNFMEEGQNIQLGYVDILMDATSPLNPGAITLNVYQDYDDNQTVNTLPSNAGSDPGNPEPDTFFNSIISTTPPTGFNTIAGSKFWQRVICPARGNFITIEYTFNNFQMANQEQQLNVQIDAQVLWFRRGGRLTSF